jgi:ubiquinone/menaquinone biosynthesis C-methylase UbiE
MFDGPSDVSTFKKNGEEFLSYFIKLGGLKPTDKILDVGSGIGRKAVPLTGYLNEDGGYEGFDIVRVGINWCRKKISRTHPNFHFQLADVFNALYNQSGKCNASEYRFPFENETFDLVVLTSVFTHMLLKDMENYLSEIARVLKNGGRCLITFFLLNEESLELIRAKKSALSFEYEMGKYRIENADIQEAAVGYEESFIFMSLRERGLTIDKPIHYGSWCGRRAYLSYQDIVVARKQKET